MRLFKKRPAKLKYINLFSGIGCWDAMENVLACEIDPHARKTFLANFSNLPCIQNGNYPTDILSLDPNNIPDFDILVGSPPCQSFSAVGQRLGLKDTRDSKGEMFFRVLDIIKVKRPKAFILENVKGLLSAEGGESFKIVCDMFNEAGYSFYHKIIRGDECGRPQMRRRVFMVGFRDEDKMKRPFTFPEPVPLKYTLKDIFKCETCDRDIGHTIMASHHDKAFGQKYNFSTYMVDGEPHTITIPEIKDIMGMPRSFEMPVSENQQKKQLGNGIIPDCGRLVAIQVLKRLQSE